MSLLLPLYRRRRLWVDIDPGNLTGPHNNLCRFFWIFKSCETRSYRNSATSLVGRHRSCGNITILSSAAFYPFKVGLLVKKVQYSPNSFSEMYYLPHSVFQANERTELFRSEPDQFWTKKFQRSYSVHFFGQITSGRWPQIISEKGEADQTHSSFTQKWMNGVTRN